MKHICSLLFTSMLFYSLAFSQITITSEDVLSLRGNSFTQEGTLSESVDVTPGMAGPDQTWDLGAIPMDSTINITWSFEPPENTPYAADFPDANFVQVFTFDTLGISLATYNYGKVSETEFISLGDVTITSFGSLADTTFDAFGDTIAIFPLTYEKSWTEVSSDTVDFFGTESITVDSTEYFVDAYGTVTVQAGAFECLRIRTTDKSTEYTVVSGITIDSTDFSSVSYIWISKEAFIIATMESQEGSSDPDFSDAALFTRLAGTGTSMMDTTVMDTTVMDTTVMDTTVMDTTISDTTTTPIQSLVEVVTDIQLSPNPARGRLTLSFTLPEKMPLDIGIYDLRGRRVHTLVSGTQSPGSYAYSWQGKTESGALIRPGWYVALLNSGERGHAIKFLWKP
ncbi:MAG: FlgD immunoglobulin-like domain containing protein [Bacteroidota bacterium]